MGCVRGFGAPVESRHAELESGQLASQSLSQPARGVPAGGRGGRAGCFVAADRKRLERPKLQIRYMARQVSPLSARHLPGLEPTTNKSRYKNHKRHFHQKRQKTRCTPTPLPSDAPLLQLHHVVPSFVHHGNQSLLRLPAQPFIVLFDGLLTLLSGCAIMPLIPAPVSATASPPPLSASADAAADGP